MARKSALAPALMGGVITATAAAGDLSKYRSFQFGTDLPALAKQVGANVSQAKVIHSRPALIQMLDWRPGAFGPTPKLTTPVAPTKDPYGGKEEVVGRWQDAQYCFDLIRSSSGPSFRLVGVLNRLDAPAQAAIREALRLDIQEAPQRDAARQASERDEEIHA